MQRALAMAEPGEALAPSHFSERITHALAPVESQVQPGDTLRETLDRLESYLLRRALDAHGGHRARTAKSLGITREGLYN